MSSPPPTVSDYINLIHAAQGLRAPESVFTPLLDNTGRPVTQPIDQFGLQAAAYFNIYTKQIIVVFVGPYTVPNAIRSFLGAAPTDGATSSDLLIANLQAPISLENDDLRFYKLVTDAATASGLSSDTSNIFVTGHSLGGFEAQYLASTYGLGGASFGGPGIPAYINAETPPNNFDNYIEAGDAIGNFSSDSGINFGSGITLGQHYQAAEKQFDRGQFGSVVVKTPIATSCGSRSRVRFSMGPTH